MIIVYAITFELTSPNWKSERACISVLLEEWAGMY